MAALATDPRGRVGERYRLVECVRVDGARQCWRAVDELARRPVRLWLYRGLDLEAAAALRCRLQALHTVRHIGLVTMYDLVDHDDEVTVVTEAGSGRSVADLLRPGQRPSLGTVRGIVSSLAEVLDELHRAGRTLSALNAADLLLRAEGAAILDAEVAAPEDGAFRPDVRALQELARALVVGNPARPDMPQAVRIAVERVSGADGRYRSARDFAGDLASAITFDDRTEVLPRERWMAFRRAATERARVRTLAGAVILAFSLGAGGVAAAAATRPAERIVARPAVAPASPMAPPAKAPAAAPTVALLPTSADGRPVTPSVVGMPRDDAARVLIAAGAASVIWRTDPMAKGVTNVVRQEPAAGQPLTRGTTVTVYLDSPRSR